MPKFTIVIPTYNRADYLAAAIESVLAQTERDFEMLIVDDGSTDNTAEVVERYIDPRAVYLERSHSGSPAITRNIGLARAAGEYIAFLDSDDLYLPDRLARHKVVLDAQSELGWVYSDVTFFRDDGSEAGALPRPTFAPSGWVFPYLLIDNFIATCSLTIRRECLGMEGYFDPAPGLVEDYEMWLRMSAWHSIAYLPGTVSRARIHGQNISGGTKLGQYLGVIDALDLTTRRYRALVAPYRRTLDERRSLIRLAAARACMQSRRWPQAAIHLAHCLAANPRPGWWKYLFSRSHPARDWLARQEALSANPVPSRAFAVPE